MNYRIEKDSLGEVKVPKDALWGAQTQRSLQNFAIGDEKMPLEVIAAYAEVKKAAAVANFDLGKLEKEKCEAIVKVCDEILDGKLDKSFPLSLWQTGSGTQTNMNLNEVIANKAHVDLGGKLEDEKKKIHPNDDVNKSQSSNDSFPTAMHVAAVRLLMQKTIPQIKKLKKSLQLKAKENENIIKIGRTHLMDATPIKMGQVLDGYARQIGLGLENLEKSVKNLLELPIGGTAVGSGLNAPDGFDKKVCENLKKQTGFAFQPVENKVMGIANHDVFVLVHGNLKTLAVSIKKIANDVRLLGSGPRAGLSELILPANEPGSSIMPGKVNPTQAEAMIMAATQVLANDVAVNLAGAGGQFELNAMKPILIYNFLQSGRILGDSCDSFAKNCVDGLKCNEKKIDEHLQNSLMLVTALNPHIGYDSAAKIAKNAYENDLTLKESGIALGILTEEEFDEWVDARKMI